MIEKLKVISACDVGEQIVGIEEARTWNYYDPHALVVVENQLVRCYDELVAIASRDDLKDRESLEVYLMITCTGG